MNNSSALLLILGIYSGFLSSLPLGPHKLLSIRNFLINTKNNYNLINSRETSTSIFISAISGLLIGQLVIILSIYNSYLYALWMRPHFVTLITLPILFFSWNRIKTLDFNTFSNSYDKYNLSKFQIQIAFLESFFLQLLNPVSFPNGIFTRLPSLFLFRYHNFLIFIFGLIFGFTGGYIVFFFSTIFLVKRLENDTPTIYRLVKRIIHQSTVSIFFVMCLISLGRTPIPSIKHFSFDQKPWQDRPWPDIFFNYNTWTRPLRLLKNNQSNLRDENWRAFNKMYFSEFYFKTSEENEKNRLIYNYPHNINIVSKDLNNLLNLSDELQYSLNKDSNYWIKYKKERLNQIHSNIKNILLNFKEETILENVGEKKINSFLKLNNILKRKYDPRLNKNFLGIKELTIKENDLLKVNTPNKLKLFLAQNLTNDNNIPVISWTNLTKKREDNINDLDLIQEENFSLQNIEEKEDTNIISLKNLFYKFLFNFKKGEEKEFIEEKDTNNEFFDENQTKIINLYKNFPAWDNQIKTTDLETPEPYESRSVLANFVRHLLPGSILARRRKALSWKTYQNRPHAPIFIRGIDTLNLKKNIFNFKNKRIVYFKNEDIYIEQSPSILKSRWDFQLAHFFRGIALCGQAYIRRYVKLPTLIICKNLSRQLLAQESQWEQDWQNLSQEIYVDCDYDGNDISVGLKFVKIADSSTGKQIKILRPFRLTYSQTSSSKNLQKTKDKETTISNLSAETNSSYTLDNYSYLTIWGDETIEPFGKIKPKAYFWRLIFERIKLIVRYQFSIKIIRFITKMSWINDFLKYIYKTIFYIENTFLNVFNSKHHEKPEQKDEFNNVINKTDIIQKTNKDPENVSTHFSKGKTDLDLNRKRKKINHNIRKSPINNNKYLQINKITIHKEIKLDKNIINHKNRIHKNTLKHKIIYIQKYVFQFRKNLLKNAKRILFFTNKIRKNIINFVSNQNKKFIRWIVQFVSYIRRYIMILINSITKIIKISIFEIFYFNKTKKETLLNEKTNTIKFNNIYNKKILSESYILHNIFQDFLMHNLEFYNLLMNWDIKNILKADTKTKFNLWLSNKNPEEFKYINFKNLLQNFNAYRPSFQIWQHNIPQYWQKEVKNQSKNFDDLKIQLKKDNLNLNYTSYHKPLFEEIEKFAKILKINLIIKQYTNYLPISNTNLKEILDKTHNKKEVNKKSENKIKQESNMYLLSSNVHNKTEYFDTIKISLLKKLPILNKKFISTKGDFNYLQLKNKFTYPPMYKNKWKFNNLKNRFRNITKIAKQRMVIKESLFYKKQKMDIPSSILKDLNIFYENLEPENILFFNILENWRYKILDDDLLTNNMITSYLKFLNKETNILNKKNYWKNSQQNSINSCYILPENFLLAENIYQLRILEKINFKAQQNHDTIVEYNTILKNDSIKLNNNESIIRFLWPSHRIEDLAYMNRCWFGTSNQSKFNLLRIRTFPID